MSPIPICILTPGGVTDAPYTATSLADAASKEPQGVYTLSRTYERTKTLLLDEHLDRLERSAALENMSVKLDRAVLRSTLRSLIERSGYAESRFRLTIPREQPAQVILSLELFQPVPPEIIQHGARVVTVHLARHNPVAKTTEWMAARKSAVEHFPPGIYEGILVSPDGLLLEGTSSNFYGIINNTLYTAGNDAVLSGIARRILLTVAPQVVPVEKTPVRLDQISQLSEAMLTSSGRGVVPIVEIDGQRIGDGKPGTLTVRLREAYDAWTTAHIESI